MQKQIHTQRDQPALAYEFISCIDARHIQFDWKSNDSYLLVVRKATKVDRYIHNAWISALLLSRIGFYQQINHTKHLHVNKYLISFQATASQWTIFPLPMDNFACQLGEKLTLMLSPHSSLPVGRYSSRYDKKRSHIPTLSLSVSLLYRASSANQHS